MWHQEPTPSSQHQLPPFSRPSKRAALQSAVANPPGSQCAAGRGSQQSPPALCAPPCAPAAHWWPPVVGQRETLSWHCAGKGVGSPFALQQRIGGGPRRGRRAWCPCPSCDQGSQLGWLPAAWLAMHGNERPATPNQSLTAAVELNPHRPHRGSHAYCGDAARVQWLPPRVRHPCLSFQHTSNALPGCVWVVGWVL